MSDQAAPSRIIDCTYVELEPAVRDERGNVLKPPLIALPDQYDAPLDGDGVAVHVETGTQVSLGDLALERPETVDAWHARVAAEAAAAAAADVEAVAGAWVQIRMLRDRWLDQAQVVIDHVDGNVMRKLSDTMLTGIATNAAGWTAWLQAMRDVPQTVAAAGLDPRDVVETAAGIHSTASTWPSPWPQPPAAPVLHLT